MSTVALDQWLNAYMIDTSGNLTFGDLKTLVTSKVMWKHVLDFLNNYPDDNCRKLNILGYMYHNGYGVKKDILRAAYYYALSENKGDIYGTLNFDDYIFFEIQNNIIPIFEKIETLHSENAELKKQLQQFKSNPNTAFNVYI